MRNIDYRYDNSLSIKAKLIQSTMDAMGMKNKIEKKMILDDFEKEPVVPGKLLEKKYHIKVLEQSSRNVWIISPKVQGSNLLVLYFHGGGYLANITKDHWRLIDKLIDKTNATIVVPDYPLAPKSKCNEVYDFIEILYNQVTTNYPKHRMIFIGDSAGAGLALGYTQQLRNKNQKQPEQIILFSPWLDVSMSNPNIELIDDLDKMLSIKGLKNAGKKYAGNFDMKDYHVSPIYGDFTNLCQISIFTGTNDLLNADALKYKKMMNDANLSLNYFEYPHMFHDWVVFSNLKETNDVLKKVKKLINNE